MRSKYKQTISLYRKNIKTLKFWDYSEEELTYIAAYCKLQQTPDFIILNATLNCTSNQLWARLFTKTTARAK